MHRLEQNLGWLGHTITWWRQPPPSLCGGGGPHLLPGSLKGRGLSPAGSLCISAGICCVCGSQSYQGAYNGCRLHGLTTWMYFRPDAVKHSSLVGCKFIRCCVWYTVGWQVDLCFHSADSATALCRLPANMQLLTPPPRSAVRVCGRHLLYWNACCCGLPCCVTGNAPLVVFIRFSAVTKLLHSSYCVLQERKDVNF